MWHSSRPKISHKTLCNNFENDGLKHVDISSKIISLQCSWLRKLCDENCHEWKITSSHLTNKYFGILHLNFIHASHLIANYLLNFPSFMKTFCFSGVALYWLFPNYLLPKKHILIEKKSIFFLYFSDKGLNFIYQLFDNNGKVKSWSSIKEEFGFNNILNFK